MICSEARLAANRRNAALSRGPRTAEGKAASRRNGFKHGLTGQGIVLPEGEANEVDTRVEAFEAELKPRTAAGSVLIHQMASLSVRAERAVEQESAAIALRVRHAADDFDESRIERANALFQTLGDDPRGTLRQLLRSPEGVDRLIDAWHDLRDDLAIEPQPLWTEDHLAKAANLLGLRARHARGSRLGALSRGYWGDFAALGEGEGGDLDESFRREWSRAMLFEVIDTELAGLEVHRDSLDFETIELDRAEAGARALFDPSKEATLARRYESEARQGFFKALKELRRVEAEAEAREELEPAQAEPEAAPTRLASEPAGSRMGSSRETTEPTLREPAEAFPEISKTPATWVEGPTGRPVFDSHCSRASA